MEIRKAKKEELEEIMDIYNNARLFMKKNGNPDQWGDSYPERELIENDIEKGNSYIALEKKEIAAVFYFAVEDDITYQKIYQGAWLNEETYGVVHRIAVRAGQKGTASFCFDWCFKQCKNLRIDTHKKNLPMQNCLKKNGFIFCGIIYVADKTERFAYQKIRSSRLKWGFP